MKYKERFNLFHRIWYKKYPNIFREVCISFFFSEMTRLNIHLGKWLNIKKVEPYKCPICKVPLEHAICGTTGQDPDEINYTCPSCHRDYPDWSLTRPLGKLEDLPLDNMKDSKVIITRILWVGWKLNQEPLKKGYRGLNVFKNGKLKSSWNANYIWKLPYHMLINTEICIEMDDNVEFRYSNKPLPYWINPLFINTNGELKIGN